MPVKLNSAGGGSVTLTTPSTASDFTLTVPAVTGSALVSTSGSSTSSTGIDFPSANTVSIKTNGTTAVTVDSSQNVGIGGTAFSGARLFLAKSNSNTQNPFFDNGPNISLFKNTNNTAGNSTSILNVDSGNRANSYIQFINVDHNYAGAIAFGTATTGASNYGERARIDSSGNLLVGTTSAGGGGGNQFRVFSDTAAKVAAEVYINAATSTATPALRVAKYDNNTTTSQVFIQFSINQFAAGSGQINANGASAAAFGTFSDRRLKENITSLPPQLDNILALKPSEFDYLDNGGHQIGFIAQEMQDVYPDVVGPGSDGMLMITGWSKTEARLVSAIQELSAKLDAAEARIAALEGAK